MLTTCGGPMALPSVLQLVPAMFASMDNFTALQETLQEGNTDFWTANGDLLTLLRSEEIDQIVYGSDMEDFAKTLDLSCVAVDPVIPMVVDMLAGMMGGSEEDEPATATKAVPDGEGDIEVMSYLMENIGGEDGIIDAYATCGGSIFTFIEVARAFLPHLRTGKGFDPIVAVAEPAFGNVVNSFDLSCLVEEPAIKPIIGQLLETRKK